MEKFLAEVDLALSDARLSETERARRFLSELAAFLYQDLSEDNHDHISAYHEWWERHHLDVLGLKVDDTQCRRVAHVLAEIFAEGQVQVRPPSQQLPPSLVANVRFLTAAQDFGGRFRGDPFDLAASAPSLFDPACILADFPGAIDRILHHIGAQAQFDKRHDYARRGAAWLQEEHGGEAIRIYEDCGGSIRAACRALTDKQLRLGFSAKKANMFVRDMFDWGIWHPGDDADLLDVAADANTMRIALRTGILRTSLVALLPSYLDVYGYQYMAVDEWTVKAWRRVWELWGEDDDTNRPTAPAFFDYLIYRLGQSTCRKTQRRCEATSDCAKKGKETCPVQGSVCDGFCPFRGICEPSTIRLQPPKAISRLGRTGWEAGRTDAGGGLGISS